MDQLALSVVHESMLVRRVAIVEYQIAAHAMPRIPKVRNGVRQLPIAISATTSGGVNACRAEIRRV